MALILYHAKGSCALAPLIALEEAGAEYELRMLDLARGDQRSAEYLAINPNGRVPSLVVGDIVITEALAVLGYVAAAFPASGMLPADPIGVARATELMAWIATSVHVSLAGVRRPGRFAADPAVHPALAETGRSNFVAALAILDARAAQVPAWMTGDAFGLVDAYLLVVRRWAEGLGLDISSWPAFAALTARALQRPSVQRALSREATTPLFYGAKIEEDIRG